MKGDIDGAGKNIEGKITALYRIPNVRRGCQLRLKQTWLFMRTCLVEIISNRRPESDVSAGSTLVRLVLIFLVMDDLGYVARWPLRLSALSAETFSDSMNATKIVGAAENMRGRLSGV